MASNTTVGRSDRTTRPPRGLVLLCGVASVLGSGCGDLPTEANGTSGSPSSSGGPGSSSSDGGTGSSTALGLDSTSGAVVQDSTTSGIDIDTDDSSSGSSSSGDPIEPQPNCGDGLVAAGELCHELGPEIVVDPSPERLAIVDLDQDGALDLIVGQPSSPELALLRGVGDGNFVAPQLLVTADGPVDDFGAADLSGDGWPDLVVTNRAAHSLTTYAGDGLGGVFFAGIYPTEVPPVRLTLGRVDAGSTVDVVAVGTADAQVLLGNGLAGFLPGHLLTLPNGPHDLRLEDLDFNGQRDLLSVNGSGASVTVALNVDGELLDSTDFATATLPRGLALGDIDGSGTLDLITAHPNLDQLGILLGDALGGFVEESLMVVADNPVATALVDLDSDGRLDLAVAHGDADALILHKGAGDGTFTDSPELAVENPQQLHIADLNNDDVLDLVVLRPSDDAIQVLLSAP